MKDRSVKIGVITDISRHIGRLMVRIAGVAGQKKFTVRVDRTNWDFGKTAINFLVISVVVCNIGVPVVWTQLGKKGNSKTGERLDLLERLLKIVPASQITVFLADREFIGHTWFKALQKQRIPYAIRVRNNQFITLSDETSWHIDIHVSLSISIYLYLSLSISIYLYLSLSISIYLYLSLSISIYLYLSEEAPLEAKRH